MERTSIGFSETTAPEYGPVVYDKDFPSEPTLIPAVITRLVDFLIQTGFIREDPRNHLILCLDEALKNAILHGNGSVATRKVTLRVHESPAAFWIVIGDEGDGFDIEDVPDPLDESGLWREGGRGIHLMRHYSKALQFWDGGSTVALCFSRETSGTSVAPSRAKEDDGDGN